MVDHARIVDVAARRAPHEAITPRDAAFERHAAELNGTPADPDQTPPELRYTQPGRVQLEWVGDVSPFAGEVLTAMDRMHLLPPKLAAALQRVALSIAYRMDGLTTRTLTKERDGLSETITWGPHRGTYVREVTARDADRILSSRSGREFRVVGYAGEQPSRDPIELYLPPHLRPVARSVTISVGPEEKLAGVVVGSGGRVGDWAPLRT